MSDEKSAKQSSRYARLKGDFWRNRKVRRLSLAARGLLATAWSYASDQMTDGRVPTELMRSWCRDAKEWNAIRSELTARVPAKDGTSGEPFITIEDGDIDAVCHEFTSHNISAEKWEKQKADAAARVARSKEKKRSGNGGGNGDGNAEGNGAGNALPNTSVTRPPLDEGRRTKEREGEGEAPPSQIVESAESAFGRQVSAVRRVWGREFHRHRGTLVTNLDDPSMRAIVASLAAKGGDFEEWLEFAADEYWSQPWPRDPKNRPGLKNFAGSLEMILADVETSSARIADVATGGSRLPTPEETTFLRRIERDGPSSDADVARVADLARQGIGIGGRA